MSGTSVNQLLSPLLALSSDHDDWLVRAFQSPSNFINSITSGATLAHMIPIEVVTNESCYEVRAQLPGVQKQDVTVKRELDYLTISAKRESRSQTTTRSEFHYGSMSRRIRLPKGSDLRASVTAKLDNGVLVVIVPRLTEQDVESNVVRVE